MTTSKRFYLKCVRMFFSIQSFSGGWVRTNTERAHQTPQKNNRNFCHVITFSVKHHIG